jgi:malonyl-CoA decarboxylase
MNSSEWLKHSVGLFSRKPHPTPTAVAHSAQALPTAAPQLAAPRSTAVRLASSKHLAGDALKPKALHELLVQLKAIVDTSISEIEGGRRAQTVAQWYGAASAAQKVDCWQLMSEQFGLEAAQMQRAGALINDGEGLSGAAEIALRRHLRCSRTALIQRFAAYPDGVRFLIDLRADLLKFCRARPEYQSPLLALDTELESLFATWFDVAFLELRRISWHSPASLIEKLIQYEAVHDIKSWADVKNRLDSDRRCFGFFHPRLPDEPLIFVEVVFTQDMADNMAPILDDTAASTDVSQAKTANFYSISNTQPGLKGVGFGDSLIKQVVQALQQELPQLKTFTTLSPIPTFRPWLLKNLTDCMAKTPDKQLKKLAKAIHVPVTAESLLLALEAKPALHPDVAQWLTQCAAQYLCKGLANGLPLDPVARFHLGNGATVARLNVAADASANGTRQSFGLMVNYLYDLKRLDKNRKQLNTGKIASLGAVSVLTF